MSLNVGVSSKQLQTNSTRKFVVGKGSRFKVRIFVVLLKFVSLQHHLSFHHPIARITVVGRVVVVVVWQARSFLIVLLVLLNYGAGLLVLVSYLNGFLVHGGGLYFLIFIHKPTCTVHWYVHCTHISVSCNQKDICTCRQFDTRRSQINIVLKVMSIYFLWILSKYISPQFP